MPKEWVMVRLQRETHERLQALARSLMDPHDRRYAKLFRHGLTINRQMPIDEAVKILIAREEAHRERAKRQTQRRDQDEGEAVDTAGVEVRQEMSKSVFDNMYEHLEGESEIGGAFYKRVLGWWERRGYPELSDDELRVAIDSLKRDDAWIADFSQGEHDELKEAKEKARRAAAEKVAREKAARKNK